MTLTPSYRQKAVYDCFDFETYNMLIEAVAGSGKTTVLLELLKRCDGETLFLAFNKSIQTEIEKSIKDLSITHAKSMTLHSLGLLAISGRFKFTIKKGKSYDIANKIKDANPKVFKGLKYSDRFKVIQMLVNMNDVSRMYLTDDVSEIKTHMMSMDKSIDSGDYIPSLWDQFLRLREKSYKRDDIEIDFTDMIYLPIHLGLKVPVSPKYLMIDEAQDLNIAQHTFIDNLINQGDVERWVAVGDRNQSIYGFSGAYASSFDLFKEKNNVKELPLDICYRCPKKVIEAANEVFDVMEGFKENDGIVDTVDDPELIKDNAMVVCRNISPLFELFFHLVSTHRDVNLKGEDILNRIVGFITPMKFDTVDTIYNKMYVKKMRLKQSKDNFDKFEAGKIEENLESIVIMIGRGFIRQTDTGSVLIEKMKQVFKENKSGITLCTIHKSKGLEADVVYILDECLIPSKFAKSPSQLIQEQNLKYVARTRAKKELYYLNLKKKQEPKANAHKINRRK
jgi:DNA helicase II / ATP-dependent DNA helicase PcrA